MQENVNHTRERVDNINSKLDSFINKVEQEYATKREVRNQQETINANCESIANLQRLFRNFLIWAVVTLLSVIGFFFATASDVIINNFV